MSITGRSSISRDLSTKARLCPLVNSDRVMLLVFNVLLEIRQSLETLPQTLIVCSEEATFERRRYRSDQQCPENAASLYFYIFLTAMCDLSSHCVPAKRSLSSQMLQAGIETFSGVSLSFVSSIDLFPKLTSVASVVSSKCSRCCIFLYGKRYS